MPTPRKLTDSEVAALVAAIKTPRTKQLERLQAYYDGTQYDGRPSYLDRESDTPRLERAPCVKYPLVKAAIDSNVALSMGGTRFPRVLSMSSEDDSNFDPDFGLAKADSEVLDQFNAKLIQVCGFEAGFRKAYRVAQAARSAALIFCYRNGLPTLDVVWPSCCTPTFDDADPTCVKSLEIRYRYVDTISDPAITGGDFWPVVREYRRVIDDTNDTVFTVKTIWDKTDTAPSTTPAKGQPVAHGFGVCPVVWYARQKQGYSAAGYDGCALHDGKLTELDAINHALSSRHLGALYAGDPIMVGTGVTPDDSLGTAGRLARAEKIDPSAKPTEWDRELYGSGGNGAIRKEPGALWRVANKDAKIGYCTLPADALAAIDQHAQDLCSKVREALRYVWIDPEKLTGSGDISGKTLAFVFSAQINLINEDRSDLWCGCILPSLGMVYRMLVTKSAGLFVPGLKKAIPILQNFLVPVASGGVAFMAPQLMPRWGDFFEPSDVDESTRCATAASSLKAGIIVKKTAVEHVKDVFAISNVDQYVDALEKEAADNQQKAIDGAAQMAKAQGGPPQAAAGPTAAAKPAVVPPRGMKKATPKGSN